MLDPLRLGQQVDDRLYEREPQRRRLSRPRVVDPDAHDRPAGSRFPKYASPLENQVAKAGYYSAKISAYDVLAEMTATTRTSRSRYTFPAGESHILFNIGQGLTTESGGYARIVSDSEIEGFKIMGDFCYGVPQSVIPVYFVVRTSKPAESVQYWKSSPTSRTARSKIGAAPATSIRSIPASNNPSQGTTSA